jgi:adenine-specific DNA-methyltransferase
MARMTEGEKPRANATGTELVWEGKRTQIERIPLPFQVIETINQSRATREQTPLLAGLPPPPLFEGVTSNKDVWRNKLIWGDNKYILASLLEEGFAGKINLIYIDPPFDTGDDFSFRVKIGDEELVKQPSIIEQKAYNDTWGKRGEIHKYLQMMYERLILMQELLKETGSIFIHVDVHMGPYIKIMMDDLFGKDNFQNEIAWYYYNKLHGTRKRCVPKAFDQILYYVKNRESNYVFHTLSEPRDKPVTKLKYRFINGKIINIKDENGKVITYESTERQIDNVWRIRCLQPANKEEWVNFDTQKPVDLIERILRISSNGNDLVLDCFSGSGSALIAAEKLGRRWIGCDLGRFAIHTTRKRLLDIPDCQPFEILNLGKYERKYWQMNGISGRQKDSEKAIFEYLAFIVKLYRAEPVIGFHHLHGRKAGRMVHVGATDAPVTLSEIIEVLEECLANKLTALDVLGWEWEMGLHDVVGNEAKRRGIDLHLLNIPREVMDKRAVEAGDVHFYELAYVETEVRQQGTEVQIALKDFIIPSLELVPLEVRDKVKKWSDYIDYWAVDWDFKEDTFHNQWQSYRTRKHSTLATESDWHNYPSPGTYKLLVKIVDIFGNDTTKLLEAKV